ncbi:aminotransferase class V-fold PLP-dependent enzyme [Candidatus Vidania fulgoroideae]|uniref:Aminotransferase class V-fold PLP-dependent enzyme n=1 Tax=Candidatus Vidania fulgoroideorum TaxID=881286 RepID=A0A974X7Y8_9PROT|nr:aminotransferase class V-fold PLP-dependent enzyme [Candidatus Vidania fulgoroideae]
MSEIIYLDNASTTMVSSYVNGKIRKYLSYYGNYSSINMSGLVIRSLIDSYKTSIANLLNCNSSEIIFTSCATESNNLALRGLLSCKSNIYVLTTTVEHSSILNVLYEFRDRITILKLPVNSNCELSNNKINDIYIKYDIYLTSIIYVNNETGIINNINYISTLCIRYGSLLHIDASQALDKLKLNIGKLQVTSLTISGHKFHSLQGIGILYINSHFVNLVKPQILGGGQQFGIRSGSLPFIQIVSICEAIIDSYRNYDVYNNKVKFLYEYMISYLKEIFPSNFFYINSLYKVPHITNMSIFNFNSNSLIQLLDNIVVSNSSACNSGLHAYSRILSKVKPTNGDLISYFRVSLSRYNSTSDIFNFVNRLKSIICSF